MTSISLSASPILSRRSSLSASTEDMPPPTSETHPLISAKTEEKLADNQEREKMMQDVYDEALKEGMERLGFAGTDTHGYRFVGLPSPMPRAAHSMEAEPDPAQQPAPKRTVGELSEDDAPLLQKALRDLETGDDYDRSQAIKYIRSKFVPPPLRFGQPKNAKYEPGAKFSAPLAKNNTLALESALRVLQVGKNSEKPAALSRLAKYVSHALQRIQPETPTSDSRAAELGAASTPKEKLPEFSRENALTLIRNVRDLESGDAGDKRRAIEALRSNFVHPLLRDRRPKNADELARSFSSPFDKTDMQSLESQLCTLEKCGSDFDETLALQNIKTKFVAPASQRLRSDPESRVSSCRAFPLPVRIAASCSALPGIAGFAWGVATGSSTGYFMFVASGAFAFMAMAVGFIASSKGDDERTPLMQRGPDRV